MECDMAVSMLKDLEDKNISVETIVMDDDTTTIARARKGYVKASLKKKSDSNHGKNQQIVWSTNSQKVQTARYNTI